MTKTAFPLEPIEKASIDELRSLQLKRLQQTLQHAYANSPVYKAKFDAAGVHPDDCKTLADIAKFPFTTKSDLRDSYPFGMFAVPRENCARIHASSGTTGKPTVVGYTLKDIDTWSTVVARSIRAGGAKPGDMVHVSYGYGLFTGGMGAHYGAEKLGLTVVPFGGGQTERQVQLIQDFKSNIIMVTPSYMLASADEFERQGIDPKTSSLRIGIFGAEPWTNDMRAAMQQHAGVFRTQASMDEGVQKIAAIRERVNAIGLKDTSKVFNTARIEALEEDNLIESAQATMVSAAARRECRGAHTVSDYERPVDDAVAPLGRDDANWMKHTLWHSANNSLTYKPVKLKPLTVDSVPPKVRTF